MNKNNLSGGTNRMFITITEKNGEKVTKKNEGTVF